MKLSRQALEMDRGRSGEQKNCVWDREGLNPTQELWLSAFCTHDDDSCISFRRRKVLLKLEVSEVMFHGPQHTLLCIRPYTMMAGAFVKKDSKENRRKGPESKYVVQKQATNDLLPILRSLPVFSTFQWYQEFVNPYKDNVLINHGLHDPIFSPNPPLNKYWKPKPELVSLLEEQFKLLEL